MLTVRQILDANKVQRATGQRMMGHFDHESCSSTGPARSLSYSPAGSMTESLVRQDEANVIRYETGEFIERLPVR